MRRGFTLVEMTVVLLIIALVTHLAMRQLGGIGEQKRVRAADRQLEEIRGSVFRYDRDGEPVGFLADMGRLVTATNGTLAELWQMPAHARRYAVRPAVRANFVATLPTDVLARLTNADIHVATGWRGPYVRLPLGRTHLNDPWGNPMENPDAAGLNRLAVTNGFALALSHFGPTALASGRRTLPLVPDGGATSRLVVHFVSQSGESTDGIRCNWYGPCDGFLTGGTTNLVHGTAHFAGLTPGVRVLWDDRTRIERLVTLRPGDNQLQVNLP